MNRKLPSPRIYPEDETNLKNLFRGGLEFIWLGQSGFLFSFDGKLCLVDAYLSNCLESSHGELPYPHDRMMAPPLGREFYPEVDYVLITHGHEDHLDPELMERIAGVNHKAEFIVPSGCAERMSGLGIPEKRIRKIRPGSLIPIKIDFLIEAFPAAHPRPDFNSDTVSALCYRLVIGDYSLFFAGDTTVFPGLMDWLQKRKFDLLILPVNGRDPEKEKNGIVGNMDFREAVILSILLGTPMMGTHYGMFAFNTVDPGAIYGEIRNFRLEDSVCLSEPGVIYHIDSIN